MMRLPAIFSDGMVIGKNARVWGWAEPGNRINIIFLGKQYEVTAAVCGRFEATILSEEYGGPHELTIGEKTIKDVHVGKVWLCGGQSNMEWPLARTRPLLSEHIKDNAQIRAFRVEGGFRFNGPAQDVSGSWQAATGVLLEKMFAVPYFFAQAIISDNIPIGLINVALGGTTIETWLPEEIIRTYPDLYNEFAPFKQPGYAENLKKIDEDRAENWYHTQEATDKGMSEGWYLPGYDHSSWKEKMLFDKSNLPEYGAVWYRKDVFLPEDFDGPVALSLGRIADIVRSYVNGELVPSLNGQYPPTMCIIPDGLLKPGKNTIAIQVIGPSTKPFFVPGLRYELTGKNKCISLLGPWKRRQGCVMPYLEPRKALFRVPTCNYNHMLAPVLGYDVDGVIWYQGESNTQKPQVYKALFNDFVAHLRTHYTEDLPVIFTQLASFVSPEHTTGDNWAQLREQQRQCQEIPNTAMAVTIDCGEWNDIHPKDKKTVGERLALCARRLAYGEDVACYGPSAKEAVINGGELIINFDHGVGLWAKNGRPLVEVIDSDEKSHHFYAKISEDTLVAQVGEIAANRVRFAWTDYPAVVLYNAYNLPASPFNIPITTHSCHK